MAEQARLTRFFADQVRSRTALAVTRLGGVTEYYTSQEALAFVNAMESNQAKADEIGDLLDDGARMMERFAETVAGIDPRLGWLERDAEDFLAEVQRGYYVDDAADADRKLVPGWRYIEPGLSAQLPEIDSVTTGGIAQGPVRVPWHVWRTAVETNDDLTDQAVKLINEIRQAEHDLDNQLGALATGLPLKGFRVPRETQQALDLLDDAGVDIKDMDPATIGNAVADRIRGVADGATHGDIEALTDLLDAFGNDIMNAAVLGAGAAVTAKAFQDLGRIASFSGEQSADRARALELAKDLRDAVAGASQTWNAEQARKFAHDLFGQIPDRPSAVAYLFADPDKDPMGEAVAVALADEIDRWERQRDGKTAGKFYHPDDARALDTGGPCLDDPMARVLETLGGYPDAALEWLTTREPDPHGGTDLGQARVDYYYGTRNSADPTPEGTSAWALGAADNATGDGFAGVAALWAGAQRAEGSLLDPGQSDPAVQEQVADLSTRIFEQLAGNDALIAEGINAHGSEELATAVTQQLDQLAVNGIGGTPTGVERADAALFERYGPEHGNYLVHVVNAERDKIAAVIGVALTRPEGLAVAAAASAEYGNRVAQSLIDDADVITTEEANRQADRVLQIDLAFEGSRIGALADAAARDEARVRQIIDYGVGYASGKLDHTFGTTVPITDAAGGITDYATDLFSDHDETIRNAEADRAAHADRQIERKAHDLGALLSRHYDQGSTDSYVEHHRGQAEIFFAGWKEIQQ
ncbi:DUF6571 family protein [Myceligenerans crystallogenes]|uniref:DUF6571 family protein n=1 Tax=Myceligenerans crystallogenes TaxID=316335 RepID=UPI0031CFB581